MSVLDRICADKKEHIKRKAAHMPLSVLEKLVEDQSAPRGFIKALAAQNQAGRPALIAEVKKASPSKGVIRADFDPVAIARIYEENGARCLSVLTDEPYFQGHDDYLKAVRGAVALPVLRKDFMLEPYQIVESRALGADCVLLIMAALSDAQAQELYDTACGLGMDVLVETHDAAELERAAALGATLIGVNNRNLKTLAVSLQTAHDLLPRFPTGALKIAESGIYTPEDLSSLWQAGYDGFLVGESLMRQDDIGAAVRTLLGTS